MRGGSDLCAKSKLAKKTRRQGKVLAANGSFSVGAAPPPPAANGFFYVGAAPPAANGFFSVGAAPPPRRSLPTISSTTLVGAFAELRDIRGEGAAPTKFPVAPMLIALMLRGVAFDLRVKARTELKPLWYRAFYVGSLFCNEGASGLCAKSKLAKKTRRHGKGLSREWLLPRWSGPPEANGLFSVGAAPPPRRSLPIISSTTLVGAFADLRHIRGEGAAPTGSVCNRYSAKGDSSATKPFSPRHAPKSPLRCSPPCSWLGCRCLSNNPCPESRFFSCKYADFCNFRKY